MERLNWRGIIHRYPDMFLEGVRGIHPSNCAVRVHSSIDFSIVENQGL